MTKGYIKTGPVAAEQPDARAPLSLPDEPKPNLESRRRSRFLSLAGMVLFVLLIALVYWPGVHAYWVRDDFFVLAYMRLVDNPWAFFVSDHFPLPGSIFRPLGYASMWLTQDWLGPGYAAQSLADMTLHIAVAGALFRVITLVLRPPALALLCTLVFALHPAVIATVLVWTNRYDVMAALFCLLAVRAAYDYRDTGRALHFAATLIFALAAMASKEVGIAALAPISLLWLAGALREPRAKTRWLALGSLLATGVIYFLWRAWVLGTVASHLTGNASLSDLIATGILRWLSYTPGYLSFVPRLDPWRRGLLALAALVFVIAAGFALAGARAEWLRSRRGEMSLSALALLCSPALLQAPVAALNAAALTVGVSAVEVAMQSRLYYLSGIGATVLVAVILGAAWEIAQRKKQKQALRVAVVASLVVAVVCFAGAARHTAKDYASRSRDIGELAQAALVAVADRNFYGATCRVYFLDVEPPPEWAVFVSMDAIIKALHPDVKQVRDCLFHNEYPTYFYLVPHGHLDARKAFPFRPLEIDGVPVPWLHMDGMDFAYLSAPSKVDRDNAGNALFFAYERGRFREVTHEVATGKREVRFQ